MKSLPNILTLSRIAVLPAMIAVFYYVPGHFGNWLAFAFYAYAGVTDFFDGYLARTLGSTSKLGQFLDPIADKLLVATTIVMLVAFDRITGVHVIAAIIILAREILVSGLREFLAGLSVRVPVTTLAKWKTLFQMLALGHLLVGEASPDWIPAVLIGYICLWLAASVTVITGYDYMRAGLKHMREESA